MTTVTFVDLKSQYLFIRNEIDMAIEKVIRSTRFIGGVEVEKFEKEFANYLGINHVIGVNSGTDALILGMRGLELKSSDEVIIPVNTFISDALAVSENGAKPVFVDIDEKDYGINLDDLKKKINARTKAIILTHLYGQSDKIDEVNEIIKKLGKKIYLVEDACQAHGAEYKKQKVGTFGIFSAFSFYPTKNLGAYGDAGVIVTDNQNLAKKYRRLHEYGQKKKYFHEIPGINSRLDALQAAILRVKLRHLDDWNKKRQIAALLYTKKLNKLVPKTITPYEFNDRKSVYYVYVVRVKKREALMNYLTKKGVTTLIHYPLPLHLQKAYGYLGYKKGDFPFAEKTAKEILSLPIFEYITGKQIDYVVKKIKEFYDFHIRSNRQSSKKS